MPTLLELVDKLSQELHEAKRRRVYEWSGSIAGDLRTLREEINAIRQQAGLEPSPLEPTWEGEEDANS